MRLFGFLFIAATILSAPFILDSLEVEDPVATYCSESSFSEDSLLESTVEIVQEEEPVSMDEMDARLEQEFGVDRFCTDALLDNVTESTPVIYYEEVVGGQFGGETHRDMFEYADGGESLQ